MIQTNEAIFAFLCWIPVTLGTTWAILGPAVMVSYIPVWVLSFIYPFMKRLIHFPQVVLGAIIGGAVFPGWVGITNELNNLDQALPLFFATAFWVIYFDIFYATRDSPDDKRIGVKSLAVLMGSHVWILLTVLGALQVAFFAVTALRANLSYIFWIFGLGVWVVSVPWHIMSLDLKDRNSGGRIFKANIKLGLYLTVVCMLELIVVRLSGHFVWNAFRWLT
jgi:4-hydroxybenzoate polyprenyltransferase